MPVGEEARASRIAKAGKVSDLLFRLRRAIGCVRPSSFQWLPPSEVIQISLPW